MSVVVLLQEMSGDANTEGCLLYLNTDHAKNRDSANGRYTFNMGNCLFTNKAVRVVPSFTSVPNIFPNINAYRNSWTEPSGNRVIAVGQYSSSGLITALNATSVDFVFAVNAAGFVTVTCTGTKVLTTSYEFLAVLGLQDAGVLTGLSRLVDGDPICNLTVVATHTGTSPINIGGEKIAVIACGKMAHSNAIFANDGKPYDILSTVSFATTVYGQTATTDGDSDLHDVKYKYYNNLDTLVFELLDGKLRPLIMPSNYNVHMVIKIFHRDGQV